MGRRKYPANETRTRVQVFIPEHLLAIVDKIVERTRSSRTTVLARMATLGARAAVQEVVDLHREQTLLARAVPDHPDDAEENTTDDTQQELFPDKDEAA